jgi:hypothetical protein
MRAVWAHRRLTLAYRPTRGVVETRPTDDVGVSFTVLSGLFARTALYMTETDHVVFRDHVTDVRRFDVKDRLRPFNLRV